MSQIARKKPDLLLRQANALTTAAYSLSQNEKKLLYAALDSVVNHGLESNELGQYPVSISHREHAEIYGDNPKSVSRYIADASKSLNKKEVIFYIPEEDSEDERALDALSWTTKRAHRPAKGTTTIFFNAELINIVTQFGQGFTQYLRGEGARLTPHAHRLYESLRQWSSRQSVTFSIEWMLERYQLPAAYSRMSDFRRRFLKPVVEEINEKTGFTVAYDEIACDSRSNRIIKIQFNYTYRDKKALTHEPTTQEEAVNTYCDLQERKRLPTMGELANLEAHLKDLVLEGFETGKEFLQAFEEAKKQAKKAEI